MAKRRPLIEALESRLCLNATLQTTIQLPEGSWEPTQYRASPLFFDIFNTGKDDVIAVASGDQIVAYADNPDGSASAVVTYKVPVGAVADIMSTPIIVKDPRTGRNDLFAALGGHAPGDPYPYDGDVFGWDLQTGNLLPGWANGVSSGHNEVGNTGVFGALTTGVLNGDGMPDIIVTSFSQEVSAITLDGSILWQWDNDDTIASGAVVADIDRDGKPEVIVGGDSSASPYFQQGGWVNVLSNTGQLKWRRQIPGEVTWSSPVVADLFNNGYLDIVIGTGDNFSYNNGVTSVANTEAGDYIYAFDPFGNMLPGWPYHTTSTGNTVGHEVLACPVVADLTGNGQLEVVTLDRAGYIHVIQPDGQDLPGFVGGKRLDPDLTQAQLVDNYGSPTIADVNGDGRPDIIAGSGPYIRAFDSSGNLIDVGQTPFGTGGIFEGIDSAPVVGNFDGTPGLTLAVATWDAISPGGANRPDKVQIYQLPPSTLAPPWPELRRTVTGDAVARSPVYDQQFVAQAFVAAMGALPPVSTALAYLAPLNNDTNSLLATAQGIAVNPLVQRAVVAKIYQAFLGHAPDGNALAFWTNYLTTHSDRQMEIQVAASSEFAQRAGNNAGQEVVLLYQAILHRTPSAAEEAAWVATGLPPATLASAYLNSAEGIADEFNGIVQAMFGAGAQALIPPDDEAAYSYDVHAGISDQEQLAQILASAANYASTNSLAAYIENLYRDVLNRMGTASDVAYWIKEVDSGAVSFGAMPFLFVHSTEAEQDYVQSQFLYLLGRTATPAELALFTSLPSRETVVIDLVGSPEYYAKNGGNNTSFIQAAFVDLALIGTTPAEIAPILAQMASGVTPAQVANGIIYSGSLYFSAMTVNILQRDIPLESQGVLRTGELPPTAAGQPVNPDPNLVNYFMSLYAAGYTDEQVLGILFSTPQYINEDSYYRGLYRTPGVRY